MFSTTREIRHFHVVVVQWRQGYVQKSVLHVQSCCFANLNLLLCCRSRWCRRRRGRCLSLPIDNFAGGVTLIWKVLIDYHFNRLPFSLREYIYIIICSDQSDQKCLFPDSLTFLPKCLNFCTQIKVSWLFPALEEFHFSLNISWSMTTNFHHLSKYFNVDLKRKDFPVFQLFYFFVCFLFALFLELVCFCRFVLSWFVLLLFFFSPYFVMQNRTDALADQQGLL